MRREEKLQILTTMAQYPAAYAAELRGLSRETLTWKPSEREWSLAEVIAHLADSEEIYLNDRIRRIVTEERPSFEGFDQDAYVTERRYNEQDPAANLARFAAANAALVALAWGLSDEAWQRVGIHSEAGELTVQELVLRVGAHHHSHLNQMRRIKSQYVRAGGRLA